MYKFGTSKLCLAAFDFRFYWLFALFSFAVYQVNVNSAKTSLPSLVALSSVRYPGDSDHEPKGITWLAFSIESAQFLAILLNSLQVARQRPRFLRPN